ncbi:MAG: transglycosylase SLT domain-containing protein [Burkholderiaceae bacterium]|nr:transglycosylase SLT domain-containing protein [Burkholderiaceae bacterium]
MTNAANFALQAVRPALIAGATFFSDIGAGVLSTARLVVTLAGCLALLAGGALISSEGARALLMARLPGGEAEVVDAQQVDQPEEPRADARVLANVGDPQQKRIVQYLSRRYRVADEAVRMLVSNAFQIGKEKNLDPLLILSVVAIESSLNPFAQSAMGAQGLMQVMTHVHAQRFEAHGGETAALDPIANMKVGSSILHELISRGGSVERGLQLYVGAGNLPDDGGYGVRVLGERTRLQLAASGKVEAAIASGRAAVAAPAAVPAPDRKPEILPVNAELNGPTDATLAHPSSNSNGDARLPVRPEQSV